MTAPPFKTALGQEELRQRTRKLGQRHRTVLLLVDGKRSRAEVLALAEKAGVAASFYEELLALGLVEDASAAVPATTQEPGPVVSAEEAAATGPGELAAEAAPTREREAAPSGAAPRPEPAATTLPEPQAATLAAPQPPAATVPEPRPLAATLPEPQALAAALPDERAADEASAAASSPALAEAPAGDEALVVVEIAEPLSDEAPEAEAGMPAAGDQPSTAPMPLSLTLPPDLPAQNRPVRARVKFPAPADEPPPFARSTGSLPLLDLPAAVPAPEQAPPLPPPSRRSPDADFQAEIEAEERLLAEVRNLLVGTLLIDGPVSGSLIALRVGRARRREELVALVWEVERSMVRSRRPREAQARLMRARDLLGLGNTLVDDDSRFDRDTAW